LKIALLENIFEKILQKIIGISSLSEIF